MNSLAPTRAADPETSFQAANRVASHLSAHKLAVLQAYRYAMHHHMGPITNDQLTDIVRTCLNVKASAQSVRSRKKTLADMGMVMHVDDYGVAEDGGVAGRWEITQKGLETLASIESEES